MHECIEEAGSSVLGGALEGELSKWSQIVRQRQKGREGSSLFLETLVSAFSTSVTMGQFGEGGEAMPCVALPLHLPAPETRGCFHPFLVNSSGEA